MIIVEGTLWPVVFLGAVDDSAIAPRDAFIVTEELLQMSETLAIGVVVAGTGDQGARSQYAALDWLAKHQEMLTSRTLRLAWVIEDKRIRASTDAWLRCMGQKFLTVRSGTFRTVQTALSWLLETPWPLGSALEGRGRMDINAGDPAMSERRTAH